MKTYCLIDGSGYIYRAFYAIPPLTAPDNTPVNAVYGFTNMLMQLLRQNESECIAVIFDAGKKNFRSEIYPQYKQNRVETPADLIPQFPLIRQAVDAFNIKSVEKEGFEADDIIAAYTRQITEQGDNVLIISADKDLMQLAKENVNIYDPMKKKVLTNSDILKKFGVSPNYITDVQALMGDSSDNIPGVKGIGPKGASNLVNTYGHLNEIYNQLDKITGRTHDLLSEQKEQAFLSLKLVSLCQNIPDLPPLCDFCQIHPSTNKISSFLSRMGFDSLQKKIPHFVSDQIQHIQKNKTKLTPFKIIRQEKDFISLTRKIKDKLFLDVIYEDLHPLKTKIIGLSLLTDDSSAYIPIFHTSETADLFGHSILTEQIHPVNIQKYLIPILTDPKIKKIAYDYKHICHLFHNTFSIDIDTKNFDDLLIMAYNSQNKNPDLSLPALSSNLLGNNPIHEDIISGQKISLIKIQSISEYAQSRITTIYQLYPILKKALNEEIYNQLDKPLLPVLYKMEKEGITVDKQKLQNLNLYFDDEIKKISQKIYQQAGKIFNINSPMQVGEILFETLQIPGGKKSKKTGAYITDVDTLKKLSRDYPIIGDILSHRTLIKLKTTYIQSLIDSTINNKIHTTYHQTTTNTGRLSSSDPNLQNIPIRDEAGRQIRSCFIAPHDYVFLSADYSQIELRLLAEIAAVPSLKSSFINEQDIHAITASEVFNIPLQDITPQWRRRAKSINFGIIYGQSAFGLAENLGISRKEARQYIDSYFEKYPQIKTYMDKTIDFAKKMGFVLTPMKRKCFIEGFNNTMTQSFASRSAINAPIQGGAADLIKKAMIEIDEKLKSYQTKMILQIHDELVFLVPRKEIDTITPLIKETMESVLKLSVPLKVDIGIGDNLNQAH